MTQDDIAMPAYVISDVIAKDAEAIEIYRIRTTAAIARHGGRYVARGDNASAFRRPDELCYKSGAESELQQVARLRTAHASPWERCR